jgi:hypothetical protein
MGPVKGLVTIDGAPLPTGNVVLHPETPNPDVKAMSAGQIKSDGSYEIFTGGKSGAPLGKYKVAVTPATVPGASGTAAPPLNMKYANPGATPLTYEVVANGEVGRYDLKLSK